MAFPHLFTNICVLRDISDLEFEENFEKISFLNFTNKFMVFKRLPEAVLVMKEGRGEF